MVFFTVYIADCLKTADLVVDDESIDLVYTDPPYGLSKGLPSPAERQKKSKFYGNIYSKGGWDVFLNDEEFKKFTEEWLKICFRKLKSNGSIIVNATHNNLFVTKELMEKAGFEFKQLIHWHAVDSTPMMTDRLFKYTIEYILWGVKGDDYTFNTTKEKYNEITKQPPDLFVCMKSRGMERVDDHPTQKPSTLNEFLIKILSNKGDVVLDMFLGSGSTMRDCKTLGRSCIGFEKRKECLPSIKLKVGWGEKSLIGEAIDYNLEVISDEEATETNKARDDAVMAIIKEFEGLISFEEASKIFAKRLKESKNSLMEV